MPTKEKLLRKLFQKRLPRNFTKQDLSALLAQCGCRKGQGGRGSGIRVSWCDNFFEKSERTQRIKQMMEYKGYHAEIKYSDEDRLFVGRVVGLSDTLAFHGASVSELEEMFHQSIDNYLALCREVGKTPEKEYKGRFNVRIPAALHRTAVLCAKQRDMSLNDLVTRALEEECAKLTAGA
jgi:hicB family protein